ncbi:MAG TPA: bifunctional diguanylate cyclase/phosphodiesterase [Gammaproteobacteria bacterium]|nr:bifunctional diguanylate cyclase/phosphodiesterase [Gammaproteobacteria bacterium]
MNIGARGRLLLLLLLLFAVTQVPAWMALFGVVPRDLLVWALALAGLSALLVVWLAAMVARRPGAPRDPSQGAVQYGAQAAANQHASLTGLPGRRELDARLYATIDQARRSGQRFALLMLDTDGFKDINGTLGHAIGDRVVIEIGQRLRRLVRASDTVAHFGGDDFVVIIADIQDVEQVQRAAEQMAAALSEAISVENLDLHVDVQFGVALYPANGETAEALIRRADIAKYDAKKANELVRFYESGRDATDRDHLALAHDLYDAVPGNQLRLFFQPRLTIASGRIEDMEGLLRWQHPERGLVPPDRFIPLAERSGSIAALTDWALREALRQLRAWLDMGFRVTVGLNVSAVDLAKPGMPDRLRGYLREFGVDPAYMIIEVTETALMHNINQALRMLESLRECGLRLAIDDYGSGWSSLAYLKRLPVDELKIDKAFVMDMVRSTDDALIVRSTIELAHAMGLKVVAEGVEDADTVRMLARFGCDTAQGYLVSKPIPADEVTAMLQLDRAHGGIPALTEALRGDPAPAGA